MRIIKWHTVVSIGILLFCLVLTSIIIKSLLLTSNILSDFSYSTTQINFKEFIPLLNNRDVVQFLNIQDLNELIIFIQPLQVKESIKYSVNVNIFSQTEELLTSKKCSSISLALFHKCYIYGDFGQPIRINISTDAPDGIFGVWSSSENYLNGGNLNVDKRVVTRELTYIGFIDGSFNGSSLFKYLGLFLVVTFVVFIIGCATTIVLFKKYLFTFIEFFTVSVFIGLSIILSVFSVTNLFYRSITIPIQLISLYGIFSLFYFIKKQYLREKMLPNIKKITQNDIIIMALLIISFFVNSIQFIKLEGPSWFDGFTHQSILDQIIKKGNTLLNNGYPTGFHTLVIFFSNLINLSTPSSMLFTGQWINIISGLCFYIYTNKLLKGHQYAIIATILFWFISPFPDYFINWSRFPFSMGLALIPIGLLVFQIYIDRQITFLPVLLLTLAIFNTHYSASVFFTAGIIAHFLRLVIKDRNINIKKSCIPFIIIIIIISIFVFGSKLLLLIKDGLLEGIIAQTQYYARQTDYLYSFGLLLQKNGWLLIVSAIIGFYVACKYNKDLARFIVLWFIMILIFIITQLLIIKASVSSFVNFIYMSYIPYSILGGFGIVELASRTIKIIKDNYHISDNNYILTRMKRFITYVLPILICLFFGFYQISIINPQTIIIQSDDKMAYEWIVEFTSSNEEFLVNSSIWGNKIMPIDGGGWINQYTQRRAYYVDNEVSYGDIVEFIKVNNIDYLYFTKKTGLIKQKWFTGCPIKYSQNGIRIIKFVDECLY